MRIGLIDVDGHNFPNLPLMKISAYHKQRGDEAGFYDPLFSGKVDICYMSKVFTFTKDYGFPVNAERIIKGGTGYNTGETLPLEIEHVYPDYGLYGIKDTAYGFLTRGCPRQCGFCIVSEKEGNKTRRVAELKEFWRGQKIITLLDANLLACEEHGEVLEVLEVLEKSGAWVDFTQGLDARLLTPETAAKIKKIKIKRIHFAMDNYTGRREIIERLLMFKAITDMERQKVSVYILCNYNTTIEQDLERVYAVNEIGFNPFVMIYEKEKLPAGHILKRMQRWANKKFIFNAENDFYKYKE